MTIDPDKHLEVIRALLEYRHEWDSTDKYEIGELVAQLDQHLSNGGELPAAWRNSDHTRTR